MSRERSNPVRFLARFAGVFGLRAGLRVSMLCLYVHRLKRHGKSFGIAQV